MKPVQIRCGCGLFWICDGYETKTWMKDFATITPALANQYLHKIVDDDDDESNKISINCLFPSLSRMERITSFKKNREL